jgi:hypothetical protein
VAAGAGLFDDEQVDRKRLQQGAEHGVRESFRRDADESDATSADGLKGGALVRGCQGAPQVECIGLS